MDSAQLHADAPGAEFLKALNKTWVGAALSKLVSRRGGKSNAPRRFLHRFRLFDLGNWYHVRNSRNSHLRGADAQRRVGDRLPNRK